MYHHDDEGHPLDLARIEKAIFALTMRNLMRSPQERADDPERIIHAFDALCASTMAAESAQAVVDLLATPTVVVRNFADVEWAIKHPGASESMPSAIADHERFAKSLHRLRFSEMPPEEVPQDDVLGLDGLGDPAEHVAVILLASAKAWSDWASIIEAANRLAS